MAIRTDKHAIPINVSYVDTVYWTFHSKIEEIDCIQSRFFDEHNFDGSLFCLQAVKSSDSSITIELQRVPIKSDERPDDGFILETYITLIGSRTAPECRIMDSDSDYVSVVYEMADLEAAENTSNCWTVKCVIKIIEMTCLENDLQEEQEELLKIIPDEFRFGKNIAKRTADMAYLMKRKSLSNIFTGRQGNAFAINKCIFMERTLYFVDEIAKKFRAKRKNMNYEQKFGMDMYLSYIYCEEFENISVREAADLYVAAHYYGLEYLQLECTEFMLKYLDNETIIDVLIVADLVCDHVLLDKTLDIFLKYESQIMDTTQWKNLVYRQWPVAHSLIDSLIRKAIAEEISQEMPQPTYERAGESTSEKIGDTWYIISEDS